MIFIIIKRTNLGIAGDSSSLMVEIEIGVGTWFTASGKAAGTDDAR